VGQETFAWNARSSKGNAQRTAALERGLDATTVVTGIEAVSRGPVRG
jgi:hypothetical protein